MKKKPMLLLLSVLFLLLFPARESLAAGIEIKMDDYVEDWLYHEETNTIYAVSIYPKELLEINAETLAITRTLSLEEMPTDLVEEEGTLYIACGKANQILCVDMETMEVKDTITTEGTPEAIAVDGTTLYYVDSRFVYQYEMKTATEKQQEHWADVYKPKMILNKKERLLYIGTYGLTGCDLSYYDLEQQKALPVCDYKDGYGFPDFGGTLLFEGNEVYYASRNFEETDATTFEGDYGNEGILAVKGNVVYTTKSVYNKRTHGKLGTYKEQARLGLATKDGIVFYSKDAKKIWKYACSEAITEQNVVEIINASEAPGIPDTKQAVLEQPNRAALTLPSTVVKWELDEERKELYALSTTDKAVFILDAESLNLKKSIVLASKPSDLVVSGGLLYVPLYERKEILVINPATAVVENVLKMKWDAYKIAVEGDRLYYAPLYTTKKDGLFLYDLKTDTEEQVLKERLSNPEFAVNSKDQILYIGESGSSASHLYYFDMKTNQILKKSDYNENRGFYNPKRGVIYDGTQVYYAGRAFYKLDPTLIVGQYGEKPDHVLYVKDNLVFTNNAVYDRKSCKAIETFEKSYDLYEMKGSDVIYYYEKAENKMVRYDFKNYATVTYDTTGGTTCPSTMTKKNARLERPKDPEKTGYVFAGWYREASCKREWKSNSDLVTGDMTLYARWEQPLEGICEWSQADKTTENSVTLEWDSVENATGYLIYCSEKSNGTYKKVADTTYLAKRIQGLSRNTTYYFKIRAYRKIGERTVYGPYSFSIKKTTAVAQVNGVKVTSSAYNKLTVTWKPVTGAKGYHIYASTSKNGTYHWVGGTKSTKFTDASVKTGTTYYYKVEAYRIVETQIFGKESEAAKGRTVLLAPTKLKAKKLTSKSAKLTWKKTSGATGYEIYRSTKKNGSYAKLAAGKTTSYTDKKLQKGKKYYYKVRAYRVVNKKKVYSKYVTIRV